MLAYQYPRPEIVPYSSRDNDNANSKNLSKFVRYVQRMAFVHFRTQLRLAACNAQYPYLIICSTLIIVAELDLRLVEQ